MALRSEVPGVALERRGRAGGSCDLECWRSVSDHSPCGHVSRARGGERTHGSELHSEMPCTTVACDVPAGTPIAVTTGTITPNVDFTLAGCSAMTLSPPILATGVVGRTFRQVFSASGGASPYGFQMTDGALPLGLTLSASSGVLEGTPTVSGRHGFTIGALDANGCATARAYTLDVQACAFTLSPTSATVPAAGGSVVVSISDPCGSEQVVVVNHQIMATPIPFVHVQPSSPGQVSFSVDANTGAAPRGASLTIGRRVFTVRQAGVGSLPPFGSLDAPLDGAQVSGSIAVGGWALDDLEVSRVQIFRDPVAGEAAVVFHRHGGVRGGRAAGRASGVSDVSVERARRVGVPDSDEHAAESGQRNVPDSAPTRRMPKAGGRCSARGRSWPTTPARRCRSGRSIRRGRARRLRGARI